MSSTVIRCPVIRGFPPAIPGVGLDKWMHRSLSPDSYKREPRRRQGRPPTPTNAAGPPVDDYQDGTRPPHLWQTPEHRGNVALCGLRAAGAVLMAALVTAGAARHRRCKTRAARARGQPRTGSRWWSRRGGVGAVPDKAVLYTGVEITGPSVGRSQGPSRPGMTDGSSRRAPTTRCCGRAMPTKAVQHPAPTISTRTAGAALTGLPGRPRTDGVAPPDAPYCMTGHGRAAESRIDRLPDQHRSGITTDTVGVGSPCGDGMDV